MVLKLAATPAPPTMADPPDDAQQAVFQVGHGPAIEDAEHEPETEHYKAKRGHSEACQRELIR